MVGYYFKTPGLYDGGWLPPPPSRFRAFLLRMGHRLGRHPEFEFGCSLCAAHIRAIDRLWNDIEQNEAKEWPEIIEI